MKTITIDGYEYQVKEQSDWTDDFNKDFQPGDYVEKDYKYIGANKWH